MLDVNPAALIAGGIDRSEVIGLPLWVTPWWSDAPTRGRSVTLERCGRSAPPRGASSRFDVDVRIEGAGRATGTLDLLLRPLRGRDGQVAFIVAEGRAITDRKRVEQRLARQNAELSALTAAPRARARLPRAAARRALARPARAAAGRHHALRAGAARRARRRRCARSSSTSAWPRSSALEQINDMLEQVKADHGEAQLTLVDADLAQAVQTVAEQFEPLAADREIELVIDVPRRVSARFDVERVSRIVSNLLANAIRHAPVGGRVRCALTRRRRRRRARASPTTAPACRRSIATGSSGASAPGSTATGARPAPAPASGWRSCASSSSCTAARSRSARRRTAARCSRVTLPLRPPDGDRVPATLAQHAAAAQRTEFVRSQLEAELAGVRAPARACRRS